MFRDNARFYPIGGHLYPSVTTILSVINKPALGPWYAREERRHFETALLDVLARPGARDPEWVLGELAQVVVGVKAADRAKQQAASIGTATHAMIEYSLRVQLGEDPGPRPDIPDAALWAFEVWRQWADEVELVPLAIERVVHDPVYGYAGTLDLYAKVKGVLTVLDWKTGKSVYPEAFLQNIAYRSAAALDDMPSAQGLIVRLPKLVDDPAPEPVWVPETATLRDFLAALRLWRCLRQLEGRPIGSWRPQAVRP